MADKVPKMQKKQHKKWMTEEILNLMKIDVKQNQT